MREIFSDHSFWFSVCAVVAGFVMLARINKSFAARRKQLKNPITSVEDDIKEFQSNYRLENKEDMHSYTAILPVIPIFLIVVGVIGVVVSVVKYLSV